MSAPIAGIVRAAEGQDFPCPGMRVSKAVPLLRFLPLLSPERQVLTPAGQLDLARTRSDLEVTRIAARNDVALAEVQLEAAQGAAARAEQLLRDDVGSARRRDETVAELELAKSRLEAAREKERRLTAIDLEGGDGGELEPIELVAPFDGVIRQVLIGREQMVPPATPLVEVIDPSIVWIRVPVYVGDIDSIVPDAPARVGSLKPGPETSLRSAPPVSAPPVADPVSATVDLYYSLTNEKGEFRPGEKVAATLEIAGQRQALVHSADRHPL